VRELLRAGLDSVGLLPAERGAKSTDYGVIPRQRNGVGDGESA
jgi:hypothetical protein